MDNKELTTEQLTMMWTVLLGLKVRFTEKSQSPFWKAVYDHGYLDFNTHREVAFRTIGEGNTFQAAAIDLAKQLRII